MNKPRVAFVVQRCGKEVNGGAEALCLAVAKHIKDICNVEVLTTCALDYMTWENHFPEGEELIDGVLIRRFEVDHPRDVEKFNRYSLNLHGRLHKVSLAEAEEWMHLQGPICNRLLKYIETHRSEYDAFIFFTYLYATTYYGLPLASHKAYLVPAAHDEWPIYLPIWNSWFEQPKLLVFSTVEEKEFLQRRFPKADISGEIIGIGIDLPSSCSEIRFRENYRITAPYILYLGRIDESKGCGELIDFFKCYKRENPGVLKLVLAGKSVMQLPKDDDIVELGFIDEQSKFDAIAGCEFLINPSPYESLSIVLLEAWSLNKPVLVTAKSDVMVGQCRRSNAGLWYADYDEFYFCIKFLQLNNNSIASNASEFVNKNYSWHVITSKYLNLIHTPKSSLATDRSDTIVRL